MEIIQSYDRLISTMGFPMLVRRHLYVESGPRSIVPTTISVPDNNFHGAHMGPTWVLSTPGGSHVGPMNLAIRDYFIGTGVIILGPQCRRSNSEWYAWIQQVNMWRIDYITKIKLSTTKQCILYMRTCLFDSSVQNGSGMTLWIHCSSVDSLIKWQLCKALMFSLR